MRLGLWVGITLLFAVVPLSANPTSVPLFNQCPHVGEALGCSYLLVFGPHGATTLLSDPNTKDVDDQEDILVGIQNNSGSYLSLSYYKGSDDAFSGIHLTGGLDDGKRTYLVTKDSYESGDGEGEYGDDGNGWHVTPEPGSIVLLGTGLVVLSGILRRKLAS